MKTKNPPPGRMVGCNERSLRRYDPDQVLRVEAPGLLSARHTGSPFNFQNEYTAVKVACQDKKTLFGFLAPEVHEAIADAALGKNVFGVGRILFQFLAEIVDIESNVMRFIPVLIAPDFGK